MTPKKRLSAQVPQPKSANDFIEAAEKPQLVVTSSTSEPSPEKESNSALPWEADHVREDVIKSVNLRLSEPYILKLQFLSEQTNKSQQRIIREFLCPALDEAINQLLESGED